MINHQLQWNNIESALNQGRLAQAMLLVGPLHCNLADFVGQVAQLILCKGASGKACFNCVDCGMIQRMEHPDMEWVKPEKNGSAIKIDQVRELQSTVFLTPQRSKRRLIVIEGADRMNMASANALLKILEEPPQHTVFILIAQQLNTVLPTILSRCQLIAFSLPEDSSNNNLLQLGDYYPAESDRARIIQDADIMLDRLLAVLERTEHPSTLAALWSQFELSSLLWFLYLVYAQLQYMHCARAKPVTGPAVNQLNGLFLQLNPVLIFTQIDKINTLLKKIGHNINVNHILVLEDLLFSLIP